MRTLILACLVTMTWSAAAWALDPIPFVRTPDAQFENLPGYAFEPHYMMVDGDLRMHYVDTGPAHAPPLLLLHGEPSWSYLYRKMIPPLAAAGYRVIAPDLIGFGRSDKPTNRSDYTYTRHLNWVEELLLALDLQQVTLFCQDWGGLIGLRLVALHPDRFSGVIAGNTALPGGPPVTIGPPSHPLPPGPTFAEWLQFSQTVPVFDSGSIVQGGTTSTLPTAVVDAYRAPFPNEDETYLAGAREFPTLVGTDLSESQAAWVVLQSWTKPFLTTFSDGDSITWGNELRFIEHVPGAANEPHVIVQNAGHFLQEDKGEELADLMLDFLARNGPGPVQAPNKCAAGKLKCVAKEKACLLKVEGKALRKGLPVDSAKRQKCRDKFDGGLDPSRGCIVKVENRQNPTKPETLCTVTGDTASLGATVDAFVDDILTDLVLDYPAVELPNKCHAALAKCVTKKCKCILKVREKAIKRGLPIDPVKLQRCFDKFYEPIDGRGCVDKVYAKQDPLKPETLCDVPGDGASLETKVDAFVDDIVGAIVTTPTPTPTPTPG